MSMLSILRAEANELGDDGPVPFEPTFADGGITRHYVARRALACDGCPAGRGIRTGEAYVVRVGLDEDLAFYRDRVCASWSPECREADEARGAAYQRCMTGPVGSPAPVGGDDLAF